VELHFEALPSFVTATFCKKNGIIHVVMREDIQGTPKEAKVLMKIDKNKNEGIILN
jgi:hypothetical protein